MGVAWLCATLFSGLPSTLIALLTGGDVMEATRAAGRMLLPQAQTGTALLGAAALVHGAVSLFWALVIGLHLPERHRVTAAMAAAAAIAVIDLLLIAPALFPSVAALPFWPQFADHLMWGACYGLGLQWWQWWRWRQRCVPPRRSKDGFGLGT